VAGPVEFSAGGHRQSNGPRHIGTLLPYASVLHVYTSVQYVTSRSIGNCEHDPREQKKFHEGDEMKFCEIL
jgi:hypothetical protein